MVMTKTRLATGWLFANLLFTVYSYSYCPSFSTQIGTVDSRRFHVRFAQVSILSLSLPASAKSLSLHY